MYTITVWSQLYKIIRRKYSSVLEMTISGIRQLFLNNILTI